MPFQLTTAKEQRRSDEKKIVNQKDNSNWSKSGFMTFRVCKQIGQMHGIISRLLPTVVPYALSRGSRLKQRSCTVNNQEERKSPRQSYVDTHYKLHFQRGYIDSLKERYHYRAIHLTKRGKYEGNAELEPSPTNWIHSFRLPRAVRLRLHN
jgi:hypothetical protein